MTLDETGMIDALMADYYFMSTNTMTIDGELVNIDGNGNRVAALIYSPKNVIILAGMNKVAKDVAEAVVPSDKEVFPFHTFLFLLFQKCHDFFFSRNCRDSTPFLYTQTCNRISLHCTCSDLFCAKIFHLLV